MVSLFGRPLALLTLSHTTSGISHTYFRRVILPLVGLSSFTTAATARSNPGLCQMTSSQDLEQVTGYLNAENAAALDMELMSTPGFTLDQLMELAGLAVAQVVYKVVVANKKNASLSSSPNILIVCGPGNNGGDGLVAARHLVLFGCRCTVVYPKQSARQPHYANLVQQCKDVGIDVVTEMPTTSLEEYNGLVDAIFGFSFQGTPREPFASILTQLMEAQSKHNIPIISVDIPSGWNVDKGDELGSGFLPQVLISLTAPKLSSKHYKGRHFIGGRFLPPDLAKKYKVQMPPYQGVDQIWEA